MTHFLPHGHPFKISEFPKIKYFDPKFIQQMLILKLIIIVFGILA